MSTPQSLVFSIVQTFNPGLKVLMLTQPSACFTVCAQGPVSRCGGHSLSCSHDSLQVCTLSSSCLQLTSGALFVLYLQTAPPAPMFMVSTSTTWISVTFTKLTGQFYVANYCCDFTQLSVSGTDSKKGTIRLCSDTIYLNLTGTEEDATYSLTAFANNTEGHIGENATMNNVITKPAGTRYSNNLRGDKSLIIAMKSMNAADITTQHDNLFKVWFCVFPKSIFTFRSSVEIRN